MPCEPRVEKKKYFQRNPIITVEGWVRVCLLWDKQHETHVVRKSTLGLGTFLSLALIGPVLNEIHTLKNSKIY